MIVGSYESELHPIVEQVIATPYDLIVEAGSAGGYYLIGFLARMPAARAIGFDTDYEMRYVCRKCAERNGVADRLTVYGACTAEALSSLAGDQRIFLICDIEGAEWDLMDPVKIPVLANWDLLVESHECYRPGITRSLIQRFSHTHIVSEIPQRPRVVEDWPVVSSLSALQKALAIEDHSGPKVWLHLKVRKPPSPSVVR